MTPLSFERICRRSRLNPLDKVFLKDHEMYLAEGYRDPDENMGEPHWKVLWAVGMGEKMDVAQEIFIPAVSTQADRISMAKDAALKFIDTCKQVKRH